VRARRYCPRCGRVSVSKIYPRLAERTNDIAKFGARLDSPDCHSHLPNETHDANVPSKRMPKLIASPRTVSHFRCEPKAIGPLGSTHASSSAIVRRPKNRARPEPAVSKRDKSVPTDQPPAGRTVTFPLLGSGFMAPRGRGVELLANRSSGYQHDLATDAVL
jgi:hypothetical protein